jgi:hypothetical protein
LEPEHVSLVLIGLVLLIIIAGLATIGVVVREEVKFWWRTRKRGKKKDG